jgi:hypothetical protein
MGPALWEERVYLFRWTHEQRSGGGRSVLVASAAFSPMVGVIARFITNYGVRITESFGVTTFRSTMTYV